jgi:predicted Zn-dependent protease
MINTMATSPETKEKAMSDPLDKTHGAKTLTRRRFIGLVSTAAAGLAAGCATNPVTGESQLMLVSEEQEIQIDRANHPHQFSADYGVVQDKALDDYIGQTGKRLAALSHRPQMPYNFHAVNATYVNAYAFPGGSIAATRGILLSLDNEAQLASLLGHELGHVNARHTARQMSKGMLTQAVVGGLAAVAGTQGQLYGQMASQLGMIGAGALLASYSRDNEREADDLGLSYMVGAGYNPSGFVGLMDMLRGLSKEKPSSIELMFATHPMSDERYQTAVNTAASTYRQQAQAPLFRERYMDQTAGVRRLKGAIEALQEGEKEMGKKNAAAAEGYFQQAVKQAPRDYTALAMMAKFQLIQKNYDAAQRYASQAIDVYPQEAQARHLNGFAQIKQRRFEQALADFTAYEKLLPGNSTTVFFKGLCLEGMQRVPQAAQQYERYLQAVQQGEQAQYAYRRLTEWGYIKPQAKQ